jgi:hypothetical protein
MRKLWGPVFIDPFSSFYMLAILLDIVTGELQFLAALPTPPEKPANTRCQDHSFLSTRTFLLRFHLATSGYTEFRLRSGSGFSQPQAASADYSNSFTVFKIFAGVI